MFSFLRKPNAPPEDCDDIVTSPVVEATSAVLLWLLWKVASVGC